ncbi:MAG: glycosyltransferase family 2 protein [Bacteroidales bacterium]|nr:glycosyltransferase family 2 protein [Bacteroidales bacterium]
MLNNKSIAVVVPAFNEAEQIGRVIETMPDFVDRIIVVNDCSRDETPLIVKNYRTSTFNEFKSKSLRTVPIHKKKHGLYSAAEEILINKNREEIRYFAPSAIENTDPENDRIILISLQKNSGVGAAIARGYKWCKDHEIDCTAVMAGDGQMDPEELESICNPVVKENIDYVKGNRLKHGSAFEVIPKTRFLGNSILSILTKIASGYWHVSDTQTGFTAISLNALNSIRLYKIYSSYGMPNDLLVKLNIAFCTLKEVTIKPVYNVGEKSKMKIFRIILPISFLLFKSFFKRLWIKYLIKDFHPLFLLYHLGFVLLLTSIPFLVKLLINMFKVGVVSTEQIVIFFVFLTITGLQSLFFAMWMDIQDNERLEK